MKRVLTIGLAVLMVVSVIGLGITGCAPAAEAPEAPEAPAEKPAAGEVYKMKYGTGTKAVTWSWPLEQEYVENIESYSGGRLKVDHYPSSTLISTKTALEDVIVRKVDEVSWSRSHHAEAFPLHILMVMGPLTTCKQFRMGYNMLLEEYFSPGDKEAGLRVLDTFGCNQYWPFIREKPVYKIEDFHGITIGITSFIQVPYCEKLGMLPVYAGGSAERYEHMARGTIEAHITGPMVIRSVGFHELGKPGYYASCGPFYICHSCHAVNLDFWNELPADLQDALQRATTDYAEKYTAESDRLFTEEVKALTEYGVVFCVWEDAEIERLITLKAGVVEEFITDMEAKGYPAMKMQKELLEEVRPAVEAEYPPTDWSAIVAEATAGK
jgi:TRAP-type C4-dicarboxylate transport system substrate-binding protein